MILNPEALVPAEIQHRLEIATKAHEAAARKPVRNRRVRAPRPTLFGRRHATA